MANSIVKVTDAVLNDSLLLLVGDDGTVTPDRETVENYLHSKTGATDIRLMHINKTDKKGVDISVDHLTYVPDVVSEVELILPINKGVANMDEVARNLYSFRLDHDYTQLFSPRRTEESAVFENETVMKGDVENSQSPSDETFSNSASTSSTPAKSKAKQVATTKSKPKDKPKIVQQIEAEFDDDFVKDEESEEEYDYEDDENDSDFELSDASKMKQPKWQKIKRRKSQSIGSKSPKVKHETPKREAPQKVREIKTKPQEAVQEQLVKIEKSVESPEKDKAASAEKKIVKKEKKPPKPIPNDFALFSTPDIIRKVVKEPEAPNTSPAKITNENRSKSSDTTTKSTDKSTRLSLDGKTTPSKPKDRRMSTERPREEKLKPTQTRKSLQSVSSNEDLSMDPIPTPEDIRSIIMTEDVKTYTTATIPSVQTSEISSTESSSVEPNITLDASALDIDQSILDNINNDEISEDILYQVAQQLVRNTDLQNAIDKGLNEGNLVLDPSIQETMLVQTPSQQTDNTSQVEDSDVTKGTQIVRPDGRIVVIPPIERPTTRSRNKRTSDEHPKTPVKLLDNEHVSGNELDSSEEEENQEEESEDDPNKLWCICNQPHNNRFMICCDTCEEWYHGKCVNITKAMGQQMEEEGKEWICLFCKDSSLKRPKAAARRIRKASRASTDSADSSKKPKKTSIPSKITCVVCHKPARENSIYCSQNCILAHASHVERVVVFERSTGKMLSGSKAPSSNNLEQWLKEHPTFEVYRSGGKIVTAKMKPKPIHPGSMVQSKLKLVKNVDNQGVSLEVQKKGIKVGLLKHFPKNTDGKNGDRPSKPTAIRSDPMPTKFYAKTATPPGTKRPEVAPSRPLKFTPPPVITKPKLIQTTLKTTPISSPKDKVQPLKTPKARQAEQQSTPKQENIRENVQKTLFEQLTNRIKLDGNMKLTDDEVKEISTEIESQLYKCFGDTGQKYRNKYRSLIFNIKDIKNQTLWKRICEKSINAYQLVRLSPDDLASQELALWREREAKHSLDMIKKSELELLNCSRQYVLKTHKGEQVVDEATRIADKIDNIEVIRTLTEENSSDGKDSKSDSGKDTKKTSKHKDRKTSKDRDHKKRRRSSSKERDKSRKRADSKERVNSSKKEKRRSRSRDRRKKTSSSSSHKSNKHKKESLISTTEKLDKKSKEILEQLVDNKIVPPLEDRLWKHVPQEDMVPEPVEESDSDHEPSSTVTIPTPPHNLEGEDQVAPSEKSTKASQEVVAKESEVERSMSPPLPKKPPTDLWKGSISMIDVAHIKISAVEVSGDCSDLSDQLPPNLDIVGRISPDTVWDYIGKMKCSNSKVISLVRLNAINVEEKMQYLALYSYLSSRKRLGVVKSTNKAIKDFYILPLASQKPIPQALLPINGPGFEESRPALLLGIIIRDRRKRGAALDPSLQYTSTSKKSRIATPPLPVIPTASSELPAQPSRSYTPPSMAVAATTSTSVNKDPRLKLTMPLPSPTEKELDDGDEPYSPEDSDPDNTLGQNFIETNSLTPTYSTYTPTIPGLEVVSDLPASKLEIQKQMEELNKKIEAQKSEIHNISKNIVSASTEIGPSALANIALPSNLQQILDSIKTISTEPTVEENPPLAAATAKQLDANLTIPLLLPQKFSRSINTSGMASPNRMDFPTNTIPLNLPTRSKMKISASDSPQGSDSPGLLSSLSEEELMKKAAEMLGETDIISPVKEKPKIVPPPLILSYNTANTDNSLFKRQKLDSDESFDIEPPIPGIDN